MSILCRIPGCTGFALPNDVYCNRHPDDDNPNTTGITREDYPENHDFEPSVERDSEPGNSGDDSPGDLS